MGAESVLSKSLPIPSTIIDLLVCMGCHDLPCLLYCVLVVNMFEERPGSRPGPSGVPHSCGLCPPHRGEVGLWQPVDPGEEDSAQDP